MGSGIYYFGIILYDCILFKGKLKFSLFLFFKLCVLVLDLFSGVWIVIQFLVVLLVEYLCSV